MSIQCEKSWLSFVLRVALFAVLPFLLLGFLPEVIGIFTSLSMSERWMKCFLGGIVLVAVRLLLKHLNPTIWYFIATFEHELTHVIAGLLTGKYPIKLLVDGEEGCVWLSGSNMLISLAPYFLPTFPLLVLFVGWFVDTRYESVLLYIYGASLANHAMDTCKECHRHQTDIIKVGYATSIIVLTLANLLFIGSLLIFIGNGYSGFANYWAQGSRRTATIIFHIGDLTMNFIAESLRDKPLANDKKEGRNIESNSKKNIRKK